ncbi:MAG: NAD(P)-dependent oxidoreductase [Planctomycetota bacterium]
MDLSRIEDGQRIVVTGAAGYVGREVLGVLAERYEVIGLDLEDCEVAGCLVRGVDLTDYSQVHAAIDAARPVAVVHLAIASIDTLRHLDPQDYAQQEIAVNVSGTRHVYESAARCGVRRVVQMSSLTVHLGLRERRWIAQDATLQPLNHYAVTKLYGEQLAWLYASQRRIASVCWRMGQPYPRGHFNLSHLAEPDNRAIGITSGDMACGLLAGLSADLSALKPGASVDSVGLTAVDGFAVANLVSASDAGPAFGYDLTAARSLGYEPGDCFTADGPVPTFEQRGRT